VTVRLADQGIRVVLLDIEGTTTPIVFVHGVLFAFARTHLAAWCRAFAGSDAYLDVTRRLAAEHAEDRAAAAPVPPWLDDTPDHLDESLRAYVGWLMDRDRKSPGLKLLQGLIWEQGYESGELHGEVYPDVPPAIRRWRDQGIGVAIYSSGSELAQRRLFASTPHGDLTPLIQAFFDTAVGSKREPSSYGLVASALNQPPAHVLFVSDVVAELEAAAGAGCKVLLAVRPGNPPQRGDTFPSTRSFDEIL